MIRIYRNGNLVAEYADDNAGRVAAARMVGKEKGGLWWRQNKYEHGEWRVERCGVGPTRVYRYGLLPPTVNADLVEQELRGAHRYHNTLIEIERWRRQRVSEILGSHHDTEALVEDVERLAKEHKEARAALKQQHKKTRSRSSLPAERERCKDLGAQLKEARARLRAAKKSIREDQAISKAIKETDAEKELRKKAARGARECEWGTGGLVEEAVRQSARTSTGLPSFVPWPFAKHRIGVQIQGGIDVADVFGDDTQLQIDPVDPRAWESPIRGERRRFSRTAVRMRVGSDGRKPVFAEWPMVMHRPLPPGKIMAAAITKRRDDCRRWRWELLITVRMEPVVMERKPGRVEVVTGCLRRDGLLCAGHYVASDGAHGEILLDPTVETRLDKAERIRSHRDELLNGMVPRLREWLSTHDLPEWLVERTASLHAWKSFGRFRALAFAWRAARFDGDDDGYDTIEAWRYRDEHLERMESGIRRHARGRRKEQYRILASKLASQYGELILPKRDRRRDRTIPTPESKRAKKTPLTRAKNIVAAYELEGALRNAFTARGGVVTERKAVETGERWSDDHPPISARTVDYAELPAVAATE